MEDGIGVTDMSIHEEITQSIRDSKKSKEEKEFSLLLMHLFSAAIERVEVIGDEDEFPEVRG